MSVHLTRYLKTVAASSSVASITIYGLTIRLALVLYSIYHDSSFVHLKYTDIDYHVFTNGSRALTNQESPYRDQEYRYPPLVAVIFIPNITIPYAGKLQLVLADIVCAQIGYHLNIYQGTGRLRSKLFLLVWLINPVTCAISTRGSFESILSLLILTTILSLIKNRFVFAGLIYGITIHLKLYPVIYALCFYSYMIQKKPYMKTQTRIRYWIRTVSPGSSQFKFFTSTLLSLSISTYVSYLYFGQDYINNSIIYHLKRKDFQHNFSIYFYLFKLLPQYQDELSFAAFIIQFLAVLIVSLVYLNFDANRQVKSRKLCFSLFAATFLFVSLNKVCTSQYFSWYLTFLPLVMDSLDIPSGHAFWIATTWLLSQANWLLFAYLYEYQKYDVIDHVGNSSILFLMSNMWIIITLCKHFNPTLRDKKDN